MKNIFGMNSKEINETIDEICKETSKMGAISYASGSKNIAFGYVKPIDKPIDYVIKLVPYQCDIDKESDLFQRLYDISDLLFFRAMQQDSSTIDRMSKSNDITLIIKALKNKFEEELLTNVLDIKIQTNNDPMNYRFQIGIAIKLDQIFIDNYEDLMNQQMIDSAIKAIQSKKAETLKEHPDNWDVNFYTGPAVNSNIFQPDNWDVNFYTGPAVNSNIFQQGFNSQIPSPPPKPQF